MICTPYVCCVHATAYANDVPCYIPSAQVLAEGGYEAENATISQGLVETNHLNFSGTGFVNNDNIAVN
mgnify:CR=1 FL=1